MNGWTLGKYALALAGICLVLTGDNLGRPWLGYVGIGLLVMAFALRFIQRRLAGAEGDSPPGDGS